MKKPLAAVVSILTNNVLSIKRALEFIGFQTEILREYKKLDKFDLIVVPGVGAFSEAMKRLVDTNLIKIVEDSLSKDKNFLGICLGMQLLFAESNEFIKTKGFSYFKSNIECFKDFKVKKKTFIGWNKVKFKENFFDNEDTRAFFNEKHYYFVHSYFAKNDNKDYIFGTSKNGQKEFVSVVKKSNLVAFQFHPEKSGQIGLNLLKETTKNFF